MLIQSHEETPKERFAIFIEKFVNNWEKERSKQDNIIIRNNWSYELYGDKIYVYYFNRQNLLGVFDVYGHKCQEVRFLEFLKRTLPEFLEYFNRDLDFIKGFKQIKEEE